jgi:proteasome accessory factor C
MPASELVERFTIPAEALEEHLSLLNLVNFGGGCYAVYAELRGDVVHVDKELFGDTFRSPPRLTPLEARAIRLALEFVGPMIAAEAHRPLAKVRRKLEETFGQFDLAQTGEPQADRVEERLIAALSQGIGQRRLVAISTSLFGEVTAVTWWSRTGSSGSSHWYVHTWDRTRDGVRSFRLDRMLSADLMAERFEPREGFEPDRLRHARVARIHYGKSVARWEVERGAQPLRDGSAVADQKVGGLDWLVGEILRFRGEAVVLEPADLRQSVAERARELLTELGLARLRVKV